MISIRSMNFSDIIDVLKCGVLCAPLGLELDYSLPHATKRSNVFRDGHRTRRY